MRLDDNQRNRFGLILLAAGGSSRLGSPKQLVQFRGKSLLRNAAEAAVASGASPVVVVLGSYAPVLQRELDGLAVDVVTNSDWEEGLSSSIRTGMAAPQIQDAAAVVLMLCDQPYISAEALAALMDGFTESGKRAVVSRYENGETGPPCVFDRSLFLDLLKLRGSRGAKQILQALPKGEIGSVAFPVGGIDIDTIEDVASLHSVSYGSDVIVPETVNVNAGSSRPLT